MKKKTQPELKTLDQVLVQDLSDEQANQVTGGIAFLFPSLATSMSSSAGKVEHLYLGLTQAPTTRRI